MKAYAKTILMVIGISIFAISCNCKSCEKDGENTTKICRDNYSSDNEYNDAIGLKQLDGYNCN